MDVVLLIVIFGAAAAGFVQGLSGSNFGLVATTIWAWCLDPTVLAPLVVGGSLTGQIIASGSLRKHFNWAHLGPMLFGGACGIPIGTYLLSYINPSEFRLVVGLLLLAWCPAMLFLGNSDRPYIKSRKADFAAGFVGGVMGGIGGLTGPAPALWASMAGWKKELQRGVIQGFNLFAQVGAFATYTASGVINHNTIKLLPVVTLSMLMPTILGIKLYNRLSERIFKRIVISFLMLSGFVLVVFR